MWTHAAGVLSDLPVHLCGTKLENTPSLDFQYKHLVKVHKPKGFSALNVKRALMETRVITSEDALLILIPIQRISGLEVT